MSYRFVTMGLILIVVASVHTLTNEIEAVRTLVVTWQDQFSMDFAVDGVLDDKPAAVLLKDGDLLPVQNPTLPFRGRGRPTWNKLKYDHQILHTVWRKEDPRDAYKSNTTHIPLTVFLGGTSSRPKESWITSSKSRSVYPILPRPSTWDPNDSTRAYSFIDSSDENVHMEIRQWPNDDHDPKCEPMHAWQSYQFPVCNIVHENNIKEGVAQQETSLVSKKGFWRHVWRMDSNNQTTVWKTFK